MIREIIGLIIIFAIELYIHLAGIEMNLLFDLGIMISGAFLLGEIFHRIKLPKVSGYLIVGILMGPFGSNAIDIRMAEDLQFIDMITLTIIAFIVGRELSIKRLKRDIKAILFYTFTVIIITFISETFLSFWLYRAIPFMGPQGFKGTLMIAIIFGFLALAKSPLTTVALLKETGAYTRTPLLILSITVLKDIVVLICFAAFMSLMKGSGAGSMGKVSWEILGSFLIGGGAGALSLLYLKFIRRQKLLMLLVLAILITIISKTFHVDNLLVAITVGFIIENFSDLGEEFLGDIEKIATFIYILFFVIRGINLDLNAVRDTWFIAIILIVMRTIITYFALMAASKIRKDPPTIYKYGWSGFINQSGVTLAMALIIRNTFPQYDALVAICISLIVLTDIVAPPIFKMHLFKIKELEEEI
ncbi:cation:proton antiporter [bacterium]|nr:cation:proton antiporter [bacterium]